MINFLTHKADAIAAVQKLDSVKKTYDSTVDRIKRSALTLFKKREKVLDQSVSLYNKLLLIDGLPIDFIKQVEMQLANQQIKRLEVKDHKINYEIPNEETSEAWKYMFGAAGVGSGAAMAGGSILTALATTFGIAGTGAAISTLSGSAASNAVLAWIGGGTIAAGGGGMALGSTILGLMGPVGWGIAGLSIVGGGWSLRSKNDKIVAEYQKATKEYQHHNDMLSNKVSEVNNLISETQSNLNTLARYNEKVFTYNFNSFSDSEKLELGKIVSDILSSLRHLNKAIV